MKPFELLSDDDLSTCVHCGLCLDACPTFRVTGLEKLFTICTDEAEAQAQLKHTVAG